MAGCQGIQQGPRVLIIAIALATTIAAVAQAQTLRCRLRQPRRISPRPSVGRRRSHSRPWLFLPPMSVKAQCPPLPSS